MGTVSQTTHYSFTDFTPFTGISYYRLKQADIDGRFKYSVTVIARLDGKLKKAVSISPNPVSDKINIRISSDVSTNAGIRIFDALGQVIYRQNERLVNGDNVFTLNNIQYFSKGIYTVQVVIDNEILSTKLYKLQ